MVKKYYKSSFVEFLCSNNKTLSSEEQRWCPQNTKKAENQNDIYPFNYDMNNVGYYKLIDELQRHKWIKWVYKIYQTYIKIYF